MSDGTIKIDTKIDDKQFDKDMQSIEKKLKKTSDNLGKMGKKLTAGVTLPIAGLFAGFAGAAMQLEATEAKYTTVFEGMTDQSDAFIKEFKKLTPATEAEARTMASGIQDLLVPLGFARDAATDLTGDMMHLSGALANFNSEEATAQDVTNAFQSALRGSYEPLSKFGIVTNKAEVEQKALSMGLADTKDELDKTHLALALNEIAYEASGDALNAYNEESLDAKTKMGLAKAEAIDLAASFGELLLPMINNLIDGVREVIAWFGGLDESQQKTIMIILAVVAAIGPLLLVISKVIGGVSSVVGVLTALNPVVLIIIAVLAVFAAMFTLLWTQNEEFRTKVMQIWNNIKDFFSTTMENLKQVIKVAIDMIKAWWDKWGDDILRVSMTIFKAVYDFVSVTIRQVRDVIKSALDFIKAFWDRWGSQIMTGWKLTFYFVRDTVKNVFSTVKSVVSGALNAIKGIFNTVTGIITGDWDKAWNGMKDTVKGVANVIGGIVNGIIGSVEAMVNAVGRAINALPSFSIPKWVPVVGGNEFGIPNIPNVSLPRVPSLDVGTDRVKSDGLAMIHKGESIVPADVAGGGYSGGKGVTVIVELDGRQIARGTAPHMVDMIRLKTGMVQ